MKKESKIKAIGITFFIFCINSFFLGIASILSPNISVSYILSYSVMIILFCKFYKSDIIEDFKNLKKDMNVFLKRVLPMSLLFIGLVYLVNSFIYNIAGVESGNQISIVQELKSSLVLMLIYTVILAPIVEELIFKIAFKHNKKKRHIDFIIITIMFTLIHFYPETNLFVYLYLISYYLLAVSFTYPFYKTNNILLSIFIHIINNLINVMIILL